MVLEQTNCQKQLLADVLQNRCFLKISQYAQERENNKETPIRMVSCEYCEFL